MRLLPEHVEQFQRRVIQDAITEATSAYWERRARDFDKVGTPAADLIATNCRRHAWLLRDIGLDAETLDLIDHQMGAAS